MKKKPLEIGDSLPDFSVIDQDGHEVSNDSIRGKNVVLFFYPRDNSPICTSQACAFRDSYEDFLEFDCEVIGISSDNVKSHKNFSKKLKLPFRLVSDENNSLREKFGVPSNLMGLLPGRVTYIADKNGIIQFIFNSQLNGRKHVKQAIRFLKSNQ
jgi:peroxiredoxin Q/BCP